MVRTDRISLLGCAAAVALSGTAYAQDVPVTADIASPDNAEEMMVVTGFRASLERAQEIKRNSSVVVESITLQDLGRFTDASISDALARVPGLNVRRALQRAGSNGDEISLRGLPQIYIQSTINGRQILGSAGLFGGGGAGGGRDLDYSSIPSEILAGVTVYKTPSAELIESGLAGSINVSTLRPLDFNPADDKMFFGSVQVSGNIETNRLRVGPRVGAVFGAKLFDGTLGLYVSGVYSNEYTRTDSFFNYIGRGDTTFQDASGAFTTEELTRVDGYSSRVLETEYQKRSVSGGIQWRPNSNLELNVDWTYNSFDVPQLERGSDFYTTFNGLLGDSTSFITPGGGTVRGGALVSFDTSRITGDAGIRPGNLLGYADNPTRSRSNYGGVNLVWKSDGGATVSADYSHGYVTSSQAIFSPFGQLIPVETAFDGSGRLPNITFNFTPPNDPRVGANYPGFNFFVLESFSQSERNAFALDAKLPVTDSIDIKIGSRFNTTQYKYVTGTARSDIANTIFDQNPVLGDGELQLPFYPIALPEITRDRVCQVYPQLCNLSNVGIGSFNGPLPQTAEGLPEDPLAFDPSEARGARETTFAVYAQADFRGKLAGIDISGNGGVRLLRVTIEGQGFQGRVSRTAFNTSPIDSASTVLVTENNYYWEVLPAFNIRFQPRDNINVRLAAARTLSLPGYSDLAPAGTASLVTPNALGFASRSEFDGGNTQLRPTTAWNYDLTVEYYTPSRGAFIGSLFYKDVSNIVTTITTVNTTLEAFPGFRFDTSQPVNLDSGKTYGFELGFSQPLSFLASPFDGLGVQGNYYFVFGRQDNAATEDTPAFGSPFLNTSKHNANGTIYYEKSGWAARVSLNYRSRYLRGFSPQIGGSFARPETAVDFSLSKKLLNDRIEVILTGSNVNGSDQVEYVGETARLFSAFRERPRTFTLGLRGSF